MSRKKKVLISHMSNEKDEIEAPTKDIANTFAKFYSSLHAEQRQEEFKEDGEIEPVQKMRIRKSRKQVRQHS